MARSPEETARILIGLYDESFAGESYKPFRIGWPELRSVAGVARLDDDYLWEIDVMLRESGYFLFPLDNFLLVALESDLSEVRAVPPRILEGCLPGDEDDDEFDEDDLELLGFDDDDEESEGPEVLGTFFSGGSDIEEPATRGSEKKATVNSGKGRKAQGSASAGQMSE